MKGRRDFIKKGVIGTAGVAMSGLALSPKSYASVVGANDRVNVAVVGVHGRGKSHINAWCKLQKSQNVLLKTLCDTDETLFEPRAKTVQELTGTRPGTVWDMRKVLDDKDIDVVSYATPNHWHALGTIWACQAGKHVYVEKPAMHDIIEGRKMIEAARKYDRRVQVGFQSRSNVNIMQAIKFIHEGGIGEIYAARGLCIKPRDSFGIAKDSTPPATFHYDRWLGPAPYRPYNEKRSHYNWHWFWDTGNGDTGNQGPHQFDIARWGMNKNVHPVSVYATGGVYGIDPDECAQQTPNTLCCAFKYADGTMLEFETRGRYSNSESSLDTRIGNIFYGTNGYLELNGGNWKAFRQREKEPFATSKSHQEEDESLTGSSGAEHFLNLLEGIRSGKNETLHCDIHEGFFSSALPLMANISYRVGRELKFMGEYEKFANDPEANTMLGTHHRPPYSLPEQV